MILVADIGGTNTRFACATRVEGEIQLTKITQIANSDAPSFIDALTAYLSTFDRVPTRACIAAAGPVKSGAVQLTNYNWEIVASELTERFGFADAALINDFVAMARAVPNVSQTSFEPLIAGTPEPAAPRLVIGPGTGLGVATLIEAADGTYIVLQGEGGHSAFAPQTDLEVDIANRLRAAHAYVSNELIVAGIGFPAVYRAFCDLYDAPHTEVSAEAIHQRAENGDEMCTALCRLRARTLLRYAGDLALANGTLGGVVLAGGVTQHLIPYLKQADIQAVFRERGAPSHYLDSCRVDILTAPHAPLIGAAAFLQTALDT